MQSTRQEILDILKVEKQATVEDLAERLELTPMTIRHHLNVLQAQNLVEASKVRRSQKVGRPRLVYTLTEAADDLFPQSYGELARYLVSEVKETVGMEGTQDILRRVADRMAQEAPQAFEGQSFEERLDQIVGFLETQGYLSHWEKTDEGYVLTNINCPYRRVSREHEEICSMDTIFINQLLGLEPQRLSCMRKDDEACCFLLVPSE
jgi:predicted ArsR family transcriptional regulator